MRLIELLECTGRVVDGVNTTLDVHPGEIKKQASKFGFDVDDDGMVNVMATNGQITKKRIGKASKPIDQRDIPSNPANPKPAGYK